VKFARHNIKNLIYSNKKKLKGKTQNRKLLMKRLSNLRKTKNIQSCWSYDSKLFYTLPTEPRKKVELRLTNPDEQLPVLNFDDRPAHQT